MTAPLVLTYRAAAYFDLGQYEEALRDFERALAHSPENTSTLLGRAKTHFKLNQKDTAEKDLAEVLRISSEQTMLDVVGKTRRESG